jgi:lipid A disaccharide synthetase
LALFKIPTIAVYKTDIISASIGRMLVNFKNVILPNFLVGENFVPFLFQEKCTVNNIYKLLRTYIDKIKEKKHLFTINSDKIVKSMNYSDINQFNFSKNSGKKIIEIINSYKY